MRWASDGAWRGLPWTAGGVPGIAASGRLSSVGGGAGVGLVARWGSLPYLEGWCGPVSGLPALAVDMTGMWGCVTLYWRGGSHVARSLRLTPGAVGGVPVSWGWGGGHFFQNFCLFRYHHIENFISFETVYNMYI